jgi:hypothetical protein
MECLFRHINRKYFKLSTLYVLTLYLFHGFALLYREITVECGGHAGAQLAQALCVMPEGHGCDSRWGHWNFSLTESFWPHYGPGVDSGCNRNEYQEYFLGVKVAGA